MRKLFTSENIDDVREFCRAAKTLLDCDPFIPVDEKSMMRASFILAGLVNLSDWVSSGFPYASPHHSVPRYWRYAKAMARRQIAKCGLRAARPKSNVSFSDLFPSIMPTPLQSVADTLPLWDAPTLFVFEEATGGGKSEAGLTLAARMMAAGLGDGIFLGLPTTATADAQAIRQDKIRALLFDDRERPTMSLIHAGSKDGLVSDADQERQAWLSDDRRRRLLADLCVGTIDQALLAAVPSKFAALRLLALTGKILVVDEAHAYDHHTLVLLENLLRFHASLGGSAVLLSATLSRRVKKRLVDAFADGAGFKSVLPSERGYPLVTAVSLDGVRTQPVARTSRAPAVRKIRLVHSVAQAQEIVLEAARRGMCVAWVRNTIDQAIEMGVALSREHGDVTVLHSRFPELTRERITATVLRRFGKDSRHGDRTGGVVVATAIIEQSLDLDFDLIVADLKTMDKLLQTFGRARRHARDALGNPLPDGSVDMRAPMDMVVLSPDPDGEVTPRWYSDLLGKASHVQPDTGALWRTAKVLSRCGEVHYEQTRHLVEEVDCPQDYGLETPPSLLAASGTVEGKRLARESVVKNAVVSNWSPSIGYVYREGVWDDDRFPTRSGVSVEIVLVRKAGDRYVPLYEGYPWSAGRLRVTDRQVLRLPCLPSDSVPEYLARACPYVRFLEIPGQGDQFVLSEFTGLRIGGAEPDCD